MQKDLVTIVVPVYNTEKYLDRCVESIVGQSYPYLDIILVDDGSLDQCPQMCDQWAAKDKRIRVIHKQNEGQGLARNVGIKNAIGDYVLFLDSDDYADCSLVERAVETAIKTDAEVIVYGHISACPSKNVFIPYIPDLPKDIYQGGEIQSGFLPEFLGANPHSGKNANLATGPWAALYSMEAIRRIGWQFVSERQIISEDTYSNMIFYGHVKKVAIIRAALYFYCNNSDSFSNTYRQDRFEKIKSFYQKCIELCHEKQYPEEVERRCKEPFVTLTIAALKQAVSCNCNKNTAMAEMKKIVDDALLQRVLLEKKKDCMNIKKRILFWTIRHKAYLLCYVLLVTKNAIGH